jgi:hypothetical protein
MKNGICLNYSRNGEGIRENGGGGELTMVYLRYCK